MARKISDILSEDKNINTNISTVREDYKPINRIGPSTKNEPKDGIVDVVDTRFYPNMYEVYRIFANKYNLDRENFILTNGCENALRIALLAVKPELMLIENPTWEMAKVICSSFDIPFREINYHFVQNKTFALENIATINNKKTWLYTTDRYNNLFEHENYDKEKYKNVIIDETYTLSNLLKNIEPEYRQFDKNEIIIGSFSKFFGCGLRLGYILFDKSWNNKMQLLREQYISSMAAKFIIEFPAINKQKILNSINVKYEYPIVSQHSCYTTVAIENEISIVPHKEFVVDNKRFMRIGV